MRAKWPSPTANLELRLDELAREFASNGKFPPLKDPGDEVEVELRRLATLAHDIQNALREFRERLKTPAGKL